MFSSIPFFRPSIPFPLRFSVDLALLLAICSASGCSSGMSMNQPPPTPTSVTVLLSSTANDKLSEFSLNITGLTLTNKAGAQVPVITSSQTAEFIHSNGAATPLPPVRIPQDTYTAATATIGAASFTCETLNSSGGLVISIFAYGHTPSSQVTVNLPRPITISGNDMGVSLNLLASPSASYSSCNPSGSVEQFSINPTFDLTPITFASQPTNDENGKETAVRGRVSSVDTGSGRFRLVTPDGLTLPLNSSTSTLFQGISDIHSLSAGMFVDTDAAIQSDGSLLATRAAVYDQTATNVMAGPLNFVDALVPALQVLGRQQQGDDRSAHPTVSDYYSFPANTVFKTSGEFTNLQNLPFVATFNGATMVAGQHIAVFSQTISNLGSYPYTSANTITLLPQTINGTVSSVSSAGSFAVYTVTLAPYDLFPALAVQPGQATVLNNPSSLEVYVDSTAQLLNTNSLAPGSVLRFYGLVFNDNGTLRMDCNQINDGVQE